mmetsp:Transcript_29216/g.43053  ORF Transcript_29216/g.43053 Transcript_29216/m.43053 type:complete len:320 (-) Transcript_29216:327-1286(-)
MDLQNLEPPHHNRAKNQDELSFGTPVTDSSDVDDASQGEKIDAERSSEIASIQVCKSYFDGALKGSETLAMVAKCIETKGFTDDNTLFAQSVCPDEINHEVGDVTNLFTEYLGEVFHMGGLAGLPFTGKTGFAAFSHHVPDDGHCFVLMAPHIGISDSHRLGAYSRDGCTSESTACGAAIAALNHCCAGKRIPSLSADPSDYQMNFLIHQMCSRWAAVANKETENHRQAALASHLWDAAKGMLDEIVNTDFGGKTSKLLVLTGIQINMPRPCEDMFQPLTFDLHLKDGTVVDIYEETFGREKPAPFAQDSPEDDPELWA